MTSDKVALVVAVNGPKTAYRHCNASWTQIIGTSPNLRQGKERMVRWRIQHFHAILLTSRLR